MSVSDEERKLRSGKTRKNTRTAEKRRTLPIKITVLKWSNVGHKINR